MITVGDVFDIEQLGIIRMYYNKKLIYDIDTDTPTGEEMVDKVRNQPVSNFQTEIVYKHHSIVYAEG